MSYDPTIAFNNPTFDRSEMELFIAHPNMPGAGDTFHYIGAGIESLAYAVAMESEEKRTIAERLPTVVNKDGGISIPLEFALSQGHPAYDAILSSGLLGLVNEEFDVLMLYGNIGVMEGGSMVADSPFAQKAKAKITMSQIGGEGTEAITVTAEVKTSGDIDRGYMALKTGSTANYDADKRTWKAAAFTKKTDWQIGDLVIGAAKA